jgi:6-pyruvoyl-tetrahydropterin synthase
MYAVEVRDHVMIAHSLPDPVFGPAQGMHGATFVVDVAFFRASLTEYAFVVDIGRATDVLKEVLSRINYRNLDTIEELAGKLTTTEFLCRWVFDRIVEAARDGRLGPGAAALDSVRVTLHESHVARAWFEGPVANA